MDHLSGVVQDHLALDNLPEQATPVLCADGREIQTGRRIVIARSSLGLAIPFSHLQQAAPGVPDLSCSIHQFSERVHPTGTA
jgi:hypothetical protein